VEHRPENHPLVETEGIEMTINWREHLPRVLPIGWRIASVNRDGFHCVNENKELSVISSVATELDGKIWQHLSCAHPDRLPSWETLKEVKTIFMGRDYQAIQVIPSEKKYINIHPYCLHLFRCLDEPDPVPDFTRGGNSL
jgi:hypothetical protein